MYERDGSPESFSSVPPVGFVEALVTVVAVVDQVVLVAPSVRGLRQLQIKNNNIIIKEEWYKNWTNQILIMLALWPQ